MTADANAGPGAALYADRTFLIEIASVEHPRLLRAALEEAAVHDVELGRVSQGSGSHSLTDAELREMVELAHENDVELFTFITSRNSWELSPDPLAGDQVCGEVAFADAVEELRRCVGYGVDGVLVHDVGLLAHAGELIRSGELGPLKLKSAAAIAPRNAATAALYARLGATSVNTAGTSTLDDLVAMRTALGPAVMLDVYVENPDGFGGGMRYRELARLVAEVAPVALKFGLRNAPDLYPYGAHLEPTAELTIREKVRRAAIALARLQSAATPTGS